MLELLRRNGLLKGGTWWGSPPGAWWMRHDKVGGSVNTDKTEKWNQLLLPAGAEAAGKRHCQGEIHMNHKVKGNSQGCKPEAAPPCSSPTSECPSGPQPLGGSGAFYLGPSPSITKPRPAGCGTRADEDSFIRNHLLLVPIFPIFFPCYLLSFISSFFSLFKNHFSFYLFSLPSSLPGCQSYRLEKTC